MPVQSMPQRIPIERWEAYFALLTAGMARHKAAKQAGIAVTTVERLHQDPRRSTGYAVYREWVANNVRDVVPPGRLGTAARKAIKDFGYFRERYFGHISMPWQVEAAHRMHELRETPGKTYVVCNAPPGSGKPLSVDGLVTMGDGTRKRLGDIAVGDHVITHTGAVARVDAVHEQGVLPAVEVADGWGRRTVAATDHPFITENGRIKAECLDGEEAPWVLAPRTVHGSYWTPDDCAMAGYFVGDGSTIGNFVITNSDPDILSDISLRSARMGWPAVIVAPRNGCASTVKFGDMRGNRRGVAMDWLRATGLRGCDSRTKRIPEQVYRAPVAGVAAFLAAYFDCDGFVDVKGSSILYSSVSRELLAGTQHLLSRLGIRSKLLIKRATYKGEPYVSWDLRVVDRTRFRDEVPVVGRKRGRLALVKDSARHYLTRHNPTTITVKPHVPVECRCLTVGHVDHSFVIDDFPVSNSTLFTHDYLLWEIVQNRALRCLIGTGAENTGADYTMRIRMSLERTLPVEADEIEAAQGLARNAKACLVHDFGRFKPEGAAYWRADKLVVAREGGEPAHQKEASFSAYGQRSGFLGGRYNIVVWDDLVNDRNSRAAVQLEELARWFRKTAETRLEPGGLFLLQGQRLGPHDLYRYALDLRDVADALDADVIDAEHLPRKYHHIVFKAHYEDRCAGVGPGKHHDVATAEPYPKGCLLDPIRLPYRELRVIQHNEPKDFACVYQQEDTDPGSVLVNPIWITGGSNPVSGEIFPGCWDLDRMVGQYPKNLSGDCWSVVTADPSPSNFWGVISWVWQSETQFQHLVNIERSRMQAPELLDWNMAAQTWTGLLEEWWQQSNDAGRPIGHVIVETNAAQRFLLQYEHAKRWSQTRGVALVSHNTGRNKADAELGVHALAPQFRHGRVRLPGHNLTRPQVLPLINEVTRYPDSVTTDLTMACWFLLWNAPQLFTRKIVRPPTFARPTWLRDRQRGFGGAA